MKIRRLGGCEDHVGNTNVTSAATFGLRCQLPTGAARTSRSESLKYRLARTS